VGDAPFDFVRFECEASDRTVPEHPIWEQFRDVGSAVEFRYHEQMWMWQELAYMHTGGDPFDEVDAIVAKVCTFPVRPDEPEFVQVLDDYSMERLVVKLKKLGVRPATFAEACYMVLACIHGECPEDLPRSFVTEMCFEDKFGEGMSAQVVRWYAEFSHIHSAGWSIGLRECNEGDLMPHGYVFAVEIDDEDID